MLFLVKRFVPPYNAFMPLEKTVARLLMDRHKTLAIAISAFFAGIAGGLFAHYITFIDPSIFGLSDLILLFSMVIVGGLASLPGSAIGTAVVFLIPEPLRFIGFPSSVIGPVREMIFALILLLILIYRPKGILGKVSLE